MFYKIVLLSCILLSSKVIAQSQIPLIGDASDLVWTKSQELEIGKATYNKLMNDGNIILSPEDQDYISYLGNKLGTYANTRLGLTFFLTNSEEINAFASLGGYVGVNAGLVIATDNEGELAGVLAHEISHVAQRHMARMFIAMRDRQVANMAAMAAGILIAAKSNGNAGSGILAGVVANETQKELDDTKQHEKEADRMGRVIMQKAGFSEISMQTFFGKLYTPEYASKAPAFLLSHPLPIDRQAAIDSFKNQAKPVNSSIEYYLFKARMISHVLTNEEITDYVKKFTNSPKLMEQQMGYYLQTLQAVKLGKFEQAKSDLAKLTTKVRNKRDVELLAIKVDLLTNNKAKAKLEFKALDKTYSNDSVVTYYYASFLYASDDYKGADNLLGKLDNFTNSSLILKLYGDTLEKLGKHNEQQKVLIDYYIATGNYENAKNQVTIALADPNIDWQTRSRLELQKKQIESIITNLK